MSVAADLDDLARSFSRFLRGREPLRAHGHHALGGNDIIAIASETVVGAP